jgi:hypothetical protein
MWHWLPGFFLGRGPVKTRHNDFEKPDYQVSCFKEEGGSGQFREELSRPDAVAAMRLPGQ